MNRDSSISRDPDFVRGLRHARTFPEGADPDISFGQGHEAPKPTRLSAAGARIEAPKASSVGFLPLPGNFF